MSKLVGVAPRPSALSELLGVDDIHIPCDRGQESGLRAWADWMLELAITPEEQRHALLPEGASCEISSLGTGRTLTELKLQDKIFSVLMSLDGESMIFTLANGQDLTVKPCGEIIEDAALNLGDLLVQALVCGRRYYNFDLAFVRDLGEETLGVLGSFRRQLVREDSSWGMTFWNIPDNIRPILARLEKPNVGSSPHGEHKICLCSVVL